MQRGAVKMTCHTARGDVSALERSRSLGDRLKDEFRKLLLIVVYLWLLFGLLALHEMLIRRELGFSYTAEGFAILNALVLGKVMLFAEDFNLGGGQRGRPMIYPILRQAALFSVLFVVFHVLEEAVVGLFYRSSRASGVTSIGGGGLLDLLTVTAILFVALVPYFAFRALTRELGWPALRKLLFIGSADAASGPATANAGVGSSRHGT
jgi:hypothetical protein